MKITIVTALWNAENLPAVIRSIDGQTVTDWQHLIINDNNPSVREIFKGVCDGVKRHWIDFGVRTHYYGGLVRSVGALLAFSYLPEADRDISNEWVVFHDDDNIWEPHHLESMINTYNYNQHVRIVASDMLAVGQHDKNFKEIRPCKLKHGGCDLGQFMYKTELFREYGYFFPHPGRKHKFDWELIKKITNKEEVAYTGLPTFIMNIKKK